MHAEISSDDLHACPNRVSFLLSRAVELSGGRMSVGHGTVWLFKQCNQVMLKVPSGVNDRASAVLCAGV
jgi:hypothetical protein